MRLVLLTGATGFVGRHVLRQLSEMDLKVRLVVRENKFTHDENYKCIESVIATKDLFAEDSQWWANVCKGVDIIIHVAWYAEPGKYLESSRNLDCLAGTLAMAKGAAQAKVKRYIGIGSCFEYDLSKGYLPVDTPLRPLTPYAGAKAAAFLALSQWLPAQGVEFAWCRLFYLYGEGEDSRRFVPYLRSNLESGKIAELTSGNQIRDFLEIREAAKMIIHVSLSQIHGPINICSGVPITVRDFAERIADEYGRRDLLSFGTRPNNLVDPSCVVGVI